MWFMGFSTHHKRDLLKYSVYKLWSMDLPCVSSSFVVNLGKRYKQFESFAVYCTTEAVSNNDDKGINQIPLSKSLACLIDESSTPTKTRQKTRMELKRLIEMRIKKRVKEQYINGKFQGLMRKVIANPMTLCDAYQCIKLNSNVDLESDDNDMPFDSMADELLNGGFDIHANTFSISTKGERKEVLVLPNLKLKVIQQAISIVVDVVYRPHFSKISHGCRSGRGHLSALRYICKEIHNSNWWFTLHVRKNVDDNVLTKLILTMEEKIEDPDLFSIIRSMSDAGVLNLKFGGFLKGHGLPQEGVLSPILINVYLDLFDQEFYKMCMTYEALDSDVNASEDGSSSKLRSWFRRQLKDNNKNNNNKHPGDMNSGLRLHACRVMDEIFFAVSGPKDVALKFKAEVQNYLEHTLYLDVHDQMEILSTSDPRGIRFLGIAVRTSERENPSVRAVHKLKEKVQLVTLQKQEAWDAGMVRIGKKWLALGLKKVKESEIKHLADSSSVLCQISCFRKAGMETDHWFKVLLKIWMQDVNAKAVDNEETVLSKYIAEPSIPKELRDSFHSFQKCAEEYISSETTSTLALLPNSNSSTQSTIIIEILAPVNVIKKRLLRYGLINSEGHARPVSALILQDNIQIIDWFSGLICRWLRWYSKCDNFSEVKLMIVNHVRKSCIRTLAAKHRLHEIEIEKVFGSELSVLPSNLEMEIEMTHEISEFQVFDADEALMYGIFSSGLCLLSLARMVSQARPCNCFVIGCLVAAPCVYTLHVMERQKFPGWRTGFSTAIHPSLNKRRVGLCKKHVKDLYLGHISLQSIDFDAWR
ncbi:nuclear intron maturase 4, mitochondrial isoform X1 [Telopea speciosissima]|uniref:nuclear intron maturase 4, mitochondrial isoform X1 n=2 Tax=Telopea speciosissima TaxID=54955 RepID=UPI001CC34816|nr:nuclear intron maturase 4, mitochondrial isoform X1 [Telopea speciosissima]